MTLDFNRARELCNQQEFALVASARAQELRAITPKRLSAKIARARGLKDKFSNLARRQARDARGKAPPRGTRPGNARTVEKAELFGEVLKRFEARAARPDRASVPEPIPRGKRSAARTKSHRDAPLPRATRSARAARPNRQQRRRSAVADSARKGVKLAVSQVPRVHAHVGSRNRRQQARRDAR